MNNIDQDSELDDEWCMVNVVGGGEWIVDVSGDE